MSGTTPDPMRDLVEDYALGALDGAERTAFEARLARDADLRRELAVTLAALGELALSSPASPPPDLKRRVMERIAAGTPRSTAADVLPLKPRATRSWTPIWLGAALAASLLLVARMSMALHDARRAETAAAAAADSERTTLAQRDSMIAQLTDPASETVTLAATGAARPLVRAYVNRAHRTMMISAAQLDSLPAGRAYQLWFIVDGKPVPSITFRPDSTGRAFLHDVTIPNGSVAAAAITQEPAGGSPAPTTPVLFVGKLTTE